MSSGFFEMSETNSLLIARGIIRKITEFEGRTE